MTILQAAILGLIQGLSEFLPISSSGHLVLAGEFMGLSRDGSGAAFEVVLHLGSLLSVLLIFRRDILELIKALPMMWQFSTLAENYRQSMACRRLVLVGLGTLPVVFAGLFFRKQILSLFGDPILVAYMLLFTAAVLVATRFVKKAANPPHGGLIVKSALFIGLAQVVALMPGVSRSGTTISMAMFCGVEREEAGRFSFFLAIPAILGAAVLELPKLWSAESSALDISAGALVVGFLCAFASGTIALAILLRLVVSGRFWVFAPYLAAVALCFIFFR